MEEDIKILETMLKIRKEQKEIINLADGYCGNCDDDIRALENSINKLKEDEAVIEEMAKDIIILDEIGQSKCSGCRNKRKEQKCIECRITDFRNKVKGEKE